MATLIAAISSNGVIGQNNHLPWKLPLDLKWFRLHTSNAAIIMGRQTYESIKSKPLPNRLNIVLSRKHETRLYQENVIWCSSLDEAINAAENLNIFVIGGGDIFRQALLCKYIDRMIITHVNVEIEGDTCTELTLPKYFKSIYKSKVFTQNGLGFYFEISIKV
jgi:dihydrofolate reductase|tara:strand:+ start:1976 stop:2464 length:489 start_codon:yes stop_codon:yes gene_type:complete